MLSTACYCCCCCCCCCFCLGLHPTTWHAGLENDEYVRKIAGYLPTAEVAFVDEIFKANSAILNALLTLLNERLFDNGNQRFPVPLMCLVRPVLCLPFHSFNLSGFLQDPCASPIGLPSLGKRSQLLKVQATATQQQQLLYHLPVACSMSCLQPSACGCTRPPL